MGCVWVETIKKMKSKKPFCEKNTSSIQVRIRWRNWKKWEKENQSSVEKELELGKKIEKFVIICRGKDWIVSKILVNLFNKFRSRIGLYSLTQKQYLF
jgi:hypothetical protein